MEDSDYKHRNLISGLHPGKNLKEKILSSIGDDMEFEIEEEY